MTKRFAFYLSPKVPYDFELTVRKPAGWPLFTPFEIYKGGILWTALHIANLLTGLKLRSVGSTEQPSILIDVFLKDIPKSTQKNVIKNLLATKLAADEDLTEFYSMARKDPILKHTLGDLYGMHDTGFAHLFAMATFAISLQMAPLKRSEEMMNCLIKNYGELAEFDGKRVCVWPLAERLAELSPNELSRLCKLGYRAKYLVQLARVLGSGGFPTLEELKQFSPEEAKRKLLELPGIGDYSADILNPHGGFPIDAWSVDVFGKLFYGEQLREGRAAIDKIKAEGIRRWGKWSWMAFLYVAHDLKQLSEKLGTSLRLY
ncbi:MAG: hypothetical protein FJ006_12360 [Chloroflexi bacterium]|nr:hypothetical protein [Chloroflexota bacterium]